MVAKVLIVIRRSQFANAKLPYGFSWTKALARRWRPDAPFALNVRIRPAGLQTGLQYASSGGQSGEEEPPWPLLVGGRVREGSIIWTPEEISSASMLDGISSDIWRTVPAAGLTVTGQTPIATPGQQETSALISDGVTGTEYTIENEVTTTRGHVYVAVIKLTIE